MTANTLWVRTTIEILIPPFHFNPKPFFFSSTDENIPLLILDASNENKSFDYNNNQKVSVITFVVLPIVLLLILVSDSNPLLFHDKTTKKNFFSSSDIRKLLDLVIVHENPEEKRNKGTKNDGEV
jgi:hypothetical protein